MTEESEICPTNLIEYEEFAQTDIYSSIHTGDLEDLPIIDQLNGNNIQTSQPIHHEIQQPTDNNSINKAQNLHASAGVVNSSISLVSNRRDVTIDANETTQVPSSLSRSHNTLHQPQYYSQQKQQPDLLQNTRYKNEGTQKGKTPSLLTQRNQAYPEQQPRNDSNRNAIFEDKIDHLKVIISTQREQIDKKSDKISYLLKQISDLNHIILSKDSETASIRIEFSQAQQQLEELKLNMRIKEQIQNGDSQLLESRIKQEETIIEQLDQKLLLSKIANTYLEKSTSSLSLTKNNPNNSKMKDLNVMLDKHQNVNLKTAIIEETKVSSGSEYSQKLEKYQQKQQKQQQQPQNQQYKINDQEEAKQELKNNNSISFHSTSASKQMKSKIQLNQKHIIDFSSPQIISTKKRADLEIKPVSARGGSKPSQNIYPNFSHRFSSPTSMLNKYTTPNSSAFSQSISTSTQNQPRPTDKYHPSLNIPSQKPIQSNPTIISSNERTTSSLFQQQENAKDILKRAHSSQDLYIKSIKELSSWLEAFKKQRADSESKPDTFREMDWQKERVQSQQQQQFQQQLHILQRESNFENRIPLKLQNKPYSVFSAKTYSTSNLHKQQQRSPRDTPTENLTKPIYSFSTSSSQFPLNSIPVLNRPYSPISQYDLMRHKKETIPQPNRSYFPIYSPDHQSRIEQTAINVPGTYLSREKFNQQQSTPQSSWSTGRSSLNTVGTTHNIEQVSNSRFFKKEIQNHKTNLFEQHSPNYSSKV